MAGMLRSIMIMSNRSVALRAIASEPLSTQTRGAAELRQVALRDGGIDRLILDQQHMAADARRPPRLRTPSTAAVAGRRWRARRSRASRCTGLSD